MSRVRVAEMVRRSRSILRAVWWAAVVALTLSGAGLVASLFRSWWALSPPGSWLQVEIDSGCLRISNVRPAVYQGVTGFSTVGMDDPRWWWPGETGFVETSSLDESELVSPRSGRLLWGVVLPLWMPAALSGGLLFALWRAGARARRRALAGCCRSCGYELAGIAGPCPECGAHAGESRTPDVERSGEVGGRE